MLLDLLTRQLLTDRLKQVKLHCNATQLHTSLQGGKAHLFAPVVPRRERGVSGGVHYIATEILAKKIAKPQHPGFPRGPPPWY